MRNFFDARSVAVVGVSDRPGNLGRSIVQNLLTFNYQGAIHLVGPRRGEVLGLPIVGAVEELPAGVDLAVILTPARAIPDILDACGEKGVRRVIIESAGFGEYGSGGAELDQRVLDAARRNDIRFIGPNCLGVVDIHNGLALPFARMENIFQPGAVSIVSQSGGVGIGYLTALAGEGIGIARFASVGNKLDVDENDLLEFLIDDESTRVVVMYLEGLRDGRRSMALARRSRKPILIHKANVGGLARDIAASHTASLAGDDEVVEAAFQQAGILRFHDTSSLLIAVRALGLPPLRGRRLAVVSRSGGHAVIVADACEKEGFRLATFPEDLLRAVEDRFRAHVIHLTNPLDLGDLFDFGLYVDIVREALSLPHVDGALFLHTYIPSAEGEASRAMFQAMSTLPDQHGRPLVLCAVSEPTEISCLKKLIPMNLFTDPVDAVRALAVSASWGEALAAKDGRSRELPQERRGSEILARCRRESRDPYTSEALALLSLRGLATPKSVLIQEDTSAVLAIKGLEAPLALKLNLRGATHKTELKGVILDIDTSGALIGAAARLREISATLESGLSMGIIAQSMAPPGLELILGGKRDTSFGPVVLLGMGGVFAELLSDVSLRVAPLSEGEAEAIIQGLRGAALLRGARGVGAIDLMALRDAVLLVSDLMCTLPEIAELDVNPIRAFPGRGGLLALDARIRLI